MHEISIMENALELAQEHARNAGASAITAIRLRVGLISGVVPEAMEFAFDALKRGTMAEKASLEIERVPAEFQCGNCGLNVRLAELRFDCPKCDGILILGNAGAELELSQLELTT